MDPLNEYIGSDDKPHTPVMIHRALMGSLERIIAILIEQYAGAFPLWLAPVQAVILPVSDAHADYAEKVRLVLAKKRIRAEVDSSKETISYRVREAQLQKVPLILVVGEKEKEAGTVSVRTISCWCLSARSRRAVTLANARSNAPLTPRIWS